MSAEELATLTGMMSQGGPNLGAPPAQARAEFEGLLASVPVSPDLKFEAAQAGGVPGLWIDAPGVRQDRVMLYLHGGGYVSGSAKGIGHWSANSAARPRRARWQLTIAWHRRIRSPQPSTISSLLISRSSIGGHPRSPSCSPAIQRAAVLS